MSANALQGRAGSAEPGGIDISTGKIKEWRSIITLIVFVLTNINVLFEFIIPIYVPKVLWEGIVKTSSALRITSKPQSERPAHGAFVRFNFPMNFVTSPLIADLFLLAITAIGKDEVEGGTIGAEGIVPYDIMLFFLSLAYIAISVDASGLIRWLAFKVLQKGGKVGHRLYFYLYLFFFALTAFIGNDPIILSGTAFLSYMTRVSSNITHPRAWIFTQFACANIASAILVSSNPTNLVLAGAFQITFIKYTANVIVPVIVTGIVLFPFLLYIIFQDENLIPATILMEDLPDHIKNKPPVNPNIPFAKDDAEDEVTDPSDTDEQKNRKQLSLEEILNPFLDKKGAIFGAVIMAATLITVLIINAVAQGSHETPVFYVTMPAAFVLVIFDLGLGWSEREKTRKIAQEGRRRAAEKKAERERLMTSDDPVRLQNGDSFATGTTLSEKTATPTTATPATATPTTHTSNETLDPAVDREHGISDENKSKPSPQTQPTTLESIIKDRYRWAEETFPTAMTVFNHLPLPLLPFAFCMFVLVQALVTKGWVPVFAHGWDHWVEKTGTVGAVGGMGFLSVVLCNASTPLPAALRRESLTTDTVRRHKHRHHDPAVARRPVVAGDSPPERHGDLGPHVLGHGVQHGDWC
ncbi:hypothetical protein OPT61_g3216 [Boeremia exigua]|uniref:Uncharacterized protein n=1 Tax=Boeremia exigua TaxID=749465 RepID=A0ACC2IIL2_9PLEO|nr:hypothetical protein OPT61_g3216 [Boeremia exigua]